VVGMIVLKRHGGGSEVLDRDENVDILFLSAERNIARIKTILSDFFIIKKSGYAAAHYRHINNNKYEKHITSRFTGQGGQAALPVNLSLDFSNKGESKMRKAKFFMFVAVCMYFFQCSSVMANDMSGLWIADNSWEVFISQNGQEINAVCTKLTTTQIETYGFKIGDQSFYGTLSGQQVTGKIHLHFPVTSKTLCPSQWDLYDDLVMTISSDGNTMQGQLFFYRLYSNCNMIRGTEPTAISFTRKAQCFHVNDDLKINITCAEYQGVRYKFNLNYISDLFWKMDANTIANGDVGNCISVGNDLKLNMSCAEFKGNIYGFTMNFTPKADDPSGIYWELDANTFKQK